MSNERLREALEGLLERYVDLANSGDAGFWNPEREKVVLNARAALAATESQPAPGAGKWDARAWLDKEFPSSRKHSMFTREFASVIAEAAFAAGQSASEEKQPAPEKKGDQ